MRHCCSANRREHFLLIIPTNNDIKHILSRSCIVQGFTGFLDLPYQHLNALTPRSLSSSYVVQFRGSPVSWIFLPCQRLNAFTQRPHASQSLLSRTAVLPRCRCWMKRETRWVQKNPPCPPKPPKTYPLDLDLDFPNR